MEILEWTSKLPLRLRAAYLARGVSKIAAAKVPRFLALGAASCAGSALVASVFDLYPSAFRWGYAQSALAISALVLAALAIDALLGRLPGKASPKKAYFEAAGAVSLGWLLMFSLGDEPLGAASMSRASWSAASSAAQVRVERAEAISQELKELSALEAGLRSRVSKLKRAEATPKPSSLPPLPLMGQPAPRLEDRLAEAHDSELMDLADRAALARASAQQEQLRLELASLGRLGMPSIPLKLPAEQARQISFNALSALLLCWLLPPVWARLRGWGLWASLVWGPASAWLLASRLSKPLLAAAYAPDEESARQIKAAAANYSKAKEGYLSDGEALLRDGSVGSADLGIQRVRESKISLALDDSAVELVLGAPSAAQSMAAEAGAA